MGALEDGQPFCGYTVTWYVPEPTCAAVASQLPVDAAVPFVAPDVYTGGPAVASQLLPATMYPISTRTVVRATAGSLVSVSTRAVTPSPPCEPLITELLSSTTDCRRRYLFAAAFCR